MDAGNIIFEYGDSTLTTLTPAIPNTSLTVDIPKRIVTGTPPTMTTTWVKVSFAPVVIPPLQTYSNMQCTVYLSGNGSGYINKYSLPSDPTGSFCVFSTQGYMPQKITLQVKAKNNAHQIVGKTFLINLY